jgi:hypothetical protein
MKNKEIIDNILELLHKENDEFDGNVYSFMKRKNNDEDAYHPVCSLTGYNTIKKYTDLYRDLYKNVVGKKKMTFKVFKDNTQQLIFDNIFDEKHIKEFVENQIEYETTELFKIYGLDMEKDVVKYEKYTFVRKDQIIHYIASNLSLNFKQNHLHIFNHLDAESKTNDYFVYLVVSHRTIDNLYSIEVMDEELPKIVNLLRFMAGIKNKDSYIDSKPFKSFFKTNIQFHNNNIRIGNEIFRKFNPIMIDHNWFSDSESGNDLLWKMLCADEKNNMQCRIFNAINWLGKAYNEEDENLSLVEIAFAFESLLQGDVKGMITPSITALLSEMYAFINGNTKEDRIQLEKEFKDFYGIRSGIAHGGKTKINYNAYQPFKMLTDTIRQLIINPLFKNCSSLDELNLVIKGMKYS